MIGPQIREIIEKKIKKLTQGKRIARLAGWHAGQAK